MAIQDTVGQIVQKVMDNPDMLTQFMQHPYSTIGKLTNNENVSQDEAAQVVTAISGLAGGKAIDFGDLAESAQKLLAENGGSVHELAGQLLGSGASAASPDVLSGLVGAVQNGGIPGVDLSDGFGLDDIMGLAGSLFGGKK